MRYPPTKTILRALLLIATLCVALTRSATADPLSFSITINFGNLGETSGYMDRQFNPGSLPGTQFASIVMDQPYWSSAFFESGDVFENNYEGYSTFDNGTVFNDLLDAASFPSTPETLDLTIDGPAVESPNHTSISGSTFAISFFDSNFNPIFTTDPDGFAGIINLNPDGTASIENFPGSDGGSVTITALNPPPPPPTIPEPNTILLLATGLSGILTRAVVRSTYPHSLKRRDSPDTVPVHQQP